MSHASSVYAILTCSPRVPPAPGTGDKMIYRRSCHCAATSHTYPPQVLMFFTVDTETFVNTVFFILFLILHVRWVLAELACL